MNFKHNRLFIKCFCMFLTLFIAFAAVFPINAAAQPAFKQELREGDKGDDVLAMQQRLFELGYLKDKPNGSFDAATVSALVLFQQHNYLLASGILDYITYEILYSDTALPYQEWEVTGEIDASFAMPGQDALQGMGNMRMPIFNEADFNTNEYGYFQENRFLSTATSPLSTFAADVDTASYAQLRAKILSGEDIPKDSVRIEEMLNYFHYEYNSPAKGEPFGVTMEIAETPWNSQTQLLLIGLQAEEIPKDERPAQNLVFLIDVSGSMDDQNKLPLVKRAFLMLADELSPSDTISIVTYASRDEVVLDGVPASEKTTIMEAINNLYAAGSTAGAAGIQSAYSLAEKHFIEEGNNRIILATDGDLNVGVSDEGSLARLVEEKKQSGVFLSVLGFGDGNYKDNKLEALANHGDGNYSYIDTIYEARRALVTEIGATFFTVAKDVKLQIDFNPAAIKGYRLIGYENRLMAAEDFADDTKDGGEIGSGHRVTVLYELVPINSDFDIGETTSKYQTTTEANINSDEMLTLSIRAKAPDGDDSILYTYPLTQNTADEMSDNLRFAAAVAEVGMLIRGSEWKGDATYASALELLRGSQSIAGDVYKEEFIYLVNLLDRAN